jgi:hypothetical protein
MYVRSLTALFLKSRGDIAFQRKLIMDFWRIKNPGEYTPLHP